MERQRVTVAARSLAVVFSAATYMSAAAVSMGLGPRGRTGVEVHVLCAVEYENEASFTHAKVFTEQPRHFSSLDGVLLARFSRGLAEAELRGHKMR